MQPPPRNTPPGGSGPPPGGSGPPPSGPNMFRRTRPQRHTAAAPASMPPVTHPMTDPFAFVRAPPPMPVGGPAIPSSTPPQMQALPDTTQSQAGPGLPLPPLSTSSTLPGSLPLSLPCVTLFNPQGAAPSPVHPSPAAGGEQSYFNSGDHASALSEPPQAASGPPPSQAAFNQEFHGQPLSQPFQPMALPYPSSQWASDHGSRPPSVQNYFQPTNDPPPFDLPPQNQMYPPSAPAAHHNTVSPSMQPGHPHVQAPLPLQNPANALNTQWPDPNIQHHHHHHHHNPPFQAQSYFSQSSAPQEPWFNQPASDSGYHQMGKSTAPPQPDVAAAQHASNLGPDVASGPAPLPYPHEGGTLSMFFKDDVENEETLAGERRRAVNGGSGSAPHLIHRQASSGQGDEQPPPLPEHSHPQYMNDGNYTSQGYGQKPSDTQDHHAENLEYVPNQEVLPSEAHCHSAAAASVEQFETGPNLETPDSISRPMRSASVSSNYSNISHGSGSATRRHQGVAGTFIQQESPRLSDEASSPPAAGRYFEQIDTSPAGVSCPQQSSLEQMWPSTPSPPKPTGNFQTSANSSFEPVRSHGVGVRPPEVDKAKMEAEGGADSAPGNLEQPPDNIENIYGSGHAPPVASGSALLTNPVVHSHSRPSSRAFGASRPCESPATTLWAPNDPASLSTNILLAPAAPTILAPLREPSTDVIQPPEDGPLDLQPVQRAQQMSQQHSENLENPPKVSEAAPTDSQGNLGYASLLVSESLQQPVLIAPPASTYSVTPSGTSAQAADQISKRETTPPVRTLTQGQAAGTSQSASGTSGQNPLVALGPISFASAASKQSPLNLTRNDLEAKSDLAALPQPQPQPQPAHPPLSRGQTLGADAHPAVPVHSQASLSPAPVSNHSQRSNYELLDFSMHQSQAQSQAPGPPPCLHESPQSTNGFYLQVTKDAQQGMKVAENPSAQTTPTSSVPQMPSASQPARTTQPQAEPPKVPEPYAMQGLNIPAPVEGSGSQPPQSQYPAPAPAPAPGPSPGGAALPWPTSGNSAPPGPAVGSAAPPGPAPDNTDPSGPVAPPGPVTGAAANPGPAAGSVAPPGPGSGGTAPPAAAAEYPSAARGPAPSGGPQSGPVEPPRPPSSAGSQHGYGPPHLPPGQAYGGYYYGDYMDSRAPYHSGQYPPQPVDLRAQQYYQDGPYRSRADGWYGRYEGHPAAYYDQSYQYREPQPERPSSRSSQYSDRPSSRQGYPEEYNRANRSAYNDYYADYKHYDYGGYNYGQYDPRHRGYYDQAYWSYNDALRARDYYNHQMGPSRKEGYDDQWRYYPGYDTSFDDDYRRRGDSYNDDFDRRSIHSEQSAHSVHSSHSHHSRRSSFSSRSQQSQVYRSQPDLVSAVYDTTSSTLAVDYSYGQYPGQNDVSQNYYGYPSEFTADGTWTAPEQPPPRPATPEKFSMPHCCARFGPGGHLLQVLPNLPSAGQPALVDIHSMEVMLQDTPEQSELRSFPGPLVREETHKVDVIKFSQNKALECARDNNLLDRDSARLLWDFIVLLCRQNGTVVGTDIADLLLKEHRSVWLPGKSPNEANLIDFNNEPLARAEEEPGAGPLSLLSDTFMTVPENVGKETERFRELLLFGRKKDALEAAMKAGLWGHALLLASKMDNRTHARVMTRFANSLPINDPLQTVYQLMSGRMPASATCCGEEKWGDWRPHLAMILSNLTHTLDLDTRTITTMGDTLASKGLLDAAHFCYLMAQVGLGVFTKKSTKMVLIGSNHSLAFSQFATNEAIQRTEAYEYAQSLGSQPCSLPNFQVFKFIYACRLAEAGLSAQAFHYCEVVSRTVLMHPGYYSPFFISQIIQMSEKLRFFDPQLKEKPEQELFNEPDWLMELRRLDGQIRTGVIQYNEDRATPTQFGSSSPSSDLDEQIPPEPNTVPTELDGPTPDNPLMTSLLPGPPPQGVQLMPPAPTSILQNGMTISQPDVPQYYPVPPGGPPGHIPMSGYPPQDPGFAPSPFQPQPEHSEMYPGSQQQCPPSYHVGQMPPHMPPQVPHSPVEMHHAAPQLLQHMPPSPGHMPPVDQLAQAPLEISSSPRRSSFTQQKDLYDQMAHMGPGRRSRTTSQSSGYLVSGRRSRTTSESSTHSGGRERSNSAIKQVSPPPPSIPEQPPKDDAKKAKKDSPKKGGGGGGGGGWLKNWFWKGKNEAHLPDDKNKSIVWDEQKQKWVDLNEPEEESKPPPPPPTGFPAMPQMPGPAAPGAPSSGGPPVNRFSRKAGTRHKYVDVLNPSKPANSGLAPNPADIFAPLAPMSMPANLFVPSSAPDDQQPLEGSEGGNPEQNSPNAAAAPQMFHPSSLPPAPEVPAVPDGSQSGESQPAQGTGGGVTFYNPAQFTQTSAAPGGGHRSGRLGGQRQYPVLK